jgi:hypothetical protein
VPASAESPPPRRRGNGLLSSHFAALADVDPRLGEHLLDLLRFAEVPAYLEPAATGAGQAPRDRLYVAAAMRDQALAVVAAAASEAGGRVVADHSPAPDGPDPSADLLDGIDTDAAFDSLVAHWDDSPADAPEVELLARTDPDAALWPEIGELRRRRRHSAADTPAESRGTDDTGVADWPDPLDELEEDHYQPPAPPPFPRLAAPTVGALVLVVFGLVVIAWADALGLGSDLGLPLGVVLILAGGGLLVTRLRDRDDEDPDADDGAVI